jgi:inorganic triphosphatase YgiF
VLEQEIKFTISQTDALDLNDLSVRLGLDVSAWQQKQLVSTYYDTESLDLIRSGVGLRLRRSGDQWLQTVKSRGKIVDGVHHRDEWEAPVEGKQFDLEHLKQTAVAPLIENSAVWAKVKPLFTTDFLRHSVHITIADHTMVELAYDRGAVRADQCSSEIHELEIELLQGSVADMQHFAEQLALLLPLEYSEVSKAEQGYRLVSKDFD